MRCPRHPDRDPDENIVNWHREDGRCDLCSMTLRDPSDPNFWDFVEKVRGADSERAEYAKRFRPAWGSPPSGREALVGLDWNRIRRGA